MAQEKKQKNANTTAKNGLFTKLNHMHKDVLIGVLFIVVVVLAGYVLIIAGDNDSTSSSESQTTASESVEPVPAEPEADTSTEASDEEYLQSLVDEAEAAENQEAQTADYINAALFAEKIGDERAPELAQQALDGLAVIGGESVDELRTLLQGIVDGDYAEDQLNELAPSREEVAE